MLIYFDFFKKQSAIEYSYYYSAPARQGTKRSCLYTDGYGYKINNTTTIQELLDYIAKCYRGSVNDYDQYDNNYLAIAIRVKNYKLFEDLIEHGCLEPLNYRCIFAPDSTHPIIALTYAASGNAAAKECLIRLLKRSYHYTNNYINNFKIFSMCNERQQLLPRSLNSLIHNFMLENLQPLIIDINFNAIERTIHDMIMTNSSVREMMSLAPKLEEEVIPIDLMDQINEIPVTTARNNRYARTSTNRYIL